MPRCVVISKLNHQRADYPAVLRAAQEAFGDKVVPLYVPVAHEGPDIDDLVALLSQTVSDYSEFSSKGRVVRQPGEDEQLLIEEHRGTLIEGVIEESEDESLMDRYMGGEDIDVDLLVDDLETAVARGSFFPVVPVCALSRTRARRAARDHHRRPSRSPSEHTFPEVYTTAGKTVSHLSCDPSGPLVAEVVKTTSDPYVGRISLARVFSGTVRPDATVHVSGPLQRVLRSRPRSRGPRRGRARRRTVVSPGQDPATRRLLHRRRHLRDREAVASRDRRHPERQGEPAGHGALVDARAAASDRSGRARQGRRGQARSGAAAACLPRTRRYGSSTRPRRSS